MNELKYEAYCLRCRVKKEIQNPELIKMKTGMNSVKGKCPNCDGKMYKILPKNKTE